MGWNRTLNRHHSIPFCCYFCCCCCCCCRRRRQSLFLYDFDVLERALTLSSSSSSSHVAHTQKFVPHQNNINKPPISIHWCSNYVSCYYCYYRCCLFANVAAVIGYIKKQMREGKRMNRKKLKVEPNKIVIIIIVIIVINIIIIQNNFCIAMQPERWRLK